MAKTCHLWRDIVHKVLKSSKFLKWILDPQIDRQFYEEFAAEIVYCMKRSNPRGLTLEVIGNMRSTFSNYLSQQLVSKIDKECTNLEVFSIKSILFAKNTIPLLKKMKNLKILKMMSIYLGGESDFLLVETIFKTCKKLVHLDLRNSLCYYEFEVTFPESLEYINLSNSLFCRQKAFENALRYCPNLKVLIIPDLDIDYASVGETINIEGEKKLEILDLSCNDMSGPKKHHFVDFRHLPNLKSLRIKGSCLQHGLLNIGKTSLTHLDISHCFFQQNLDDNTFLRELKDLHINHLVCNNYDFSVAGGVIFQLAQFKYLQKLELCEWRNLKPKTVKLFFISLSRNILKSCTVSR